MVRIITIVCFLIAAAELDAQPHTTSYSYGFETPLTNPPWVPEGGTNISEIVNDPTTGGSNRVLKVALPLPASNQVWNNSSTRSEIRWQKGANRIPNWFPNKSDYTYHFRLYVPDSHACDPLEPEIIAQWHQPNGFKIRSPPLSIRVQDCNIKLRYITSEKFDDTQRNAIKNTVSSSVDLTKGSWHYFIVDVHWDYQVTNGSGLVRVYMNTAGWPGSDDLIINYSGPVGQNDGIGANFKLGVYKWRWKFTESVEKARDQLPAAMERVYYYDDVTIKKGLEF